MKALVTGASRGIGLAVAEAFGQPVMRRQALAVDAKAALGRLDDEAVEFQLGKPASD